ncbi:MAG: GntR family transcriptional regulator [Planctomycetales bacterium]|nr:GntR family transcriptional regulator [Planctomycetales bacterium]
MIQFKLDKNSFVPFYRQIVDMVLSGISAGTLLPGERLPTIRDMAVKLEINPNTVVKAYSQLQLLSVLDMQQGTGVFVRPNVVGSVAAEEKQKAAEILCRDFVGRAQLQNISIDDLIKYLNDMQKHA